MNGATASGLANLPSRNPKTLRRCVAVSRSKPKSSLPPSLPNPIYALENILEPSHWPKVFDLSLNPRQQKMRRSPAVLSAAVSRLNRPGVGSVCGRCFGDRPGSVTAPRLNGSSPVAPSSQLEKSGVHALSSSHLDSDLARKISINDNISRKDRFNFLVNTLLDLRDSKESVYGALDAWVAWERDFPIASLRRALIMLEKEHQWHRIIQVIKWMLSKGQGNTMGNYRMLIRALDMDHRAEEAHQFWEKKIGSDLHSVPWKLCTCMIGIYYRNNMLEHLVKLFKGLEAFDRKPPEKYVVQRVADAYEALGLPDEKTRIMEKYEPLFADKTLDRGKRRSSSKKGKKEGKHSSDSVDCSTSSDGKL